MFQSNYVKLWVVYIYLNRWEVQKEDIKLYRNKVWDILELNWTNVMLMVNGNIVNLPGSVILPF